ncbi:MAG: MerR family transcriptional regulator [Chloroflexota bacterium]|nr:MAG: MerR family transcriptional regulator [Chloroflexota bacterium]
MDGPSKTPAFNLKVVIRETGLKADTLRAWERRYGLPNPQRTAGGHRLYSQHDIEMIKWLMERQSEGLRINRAVELWHSFEEQGQDPLQMMPTAGAMQPVVSGESLSGATLDEVREQWIAACLVFDEVRAENLLAQAFARYPLETVCLEVLRQGISEIGNLWYTGKSSVQQEHFASALAIRRLNALLAAAPNPSRQGKILTACPPGEDHIFSLLLITLFLRLRGWEVIYLGANVPINKLDDTIRISRPDVVISVAQQLFTAANLFEIAKYLQAEKVPLAYGGLIFNLIPNLRERIPGHFLGNSLDDIVQSVEQLMYHPAEVLEVDPVHEIYLQAADHFEEYQPMITANMWEKFQRTGMELSHLQIANEFLGKDIHASLSLGDLSLLENEMDWLAVLLNTHNIPSEILPEYLVSYKQAVEANLDQRGQPVVDWLNSVISTS